MRASRTVGPVMIRGILQVITMLFLLRLLFWFLRLVSSGMRSEPDPGAERMSGPSDGEARRRRSLREDRANATDVPFTEIPAEQPPADADAAPAERAEAR
jgi:hypothetical protein